MVLSAERTFSKLKIIFDLTFSKSKPTLLSIISLKMRLLSFDEFVEKWARKIRWFNQDITLIKYYYLLCCIKCDIQNINKLVTFLQHLVMPLGLSSPKTPVACSFHCTVDLLQSPFLLRVLEAGSLFDESMWETDPRMLPVVWVGPVMCL